ncbi:MAG: four-helix bundle copper-binding protein [Myxococcota bacterium]
MDRREFVSGTILAGLALATAAEAATPAPALPSPYLAAGGATASIDALAASARACVAAADACIRHCAQELAVGDKEMADCNWAVHAVHATSGATVTLASLRSARLAEMLPATIAAAKACSTACHEHESHWAMGMHLECKACAEACDALVTAAQATQKLL